MATTEHTPTRVFGMLAMVAFSTFVMWLGVRCWRGEEASAVADHERNVGPWPLLTGSMRTYQTLMGSTYLMVVFAVGSTLIGATDLLRMALGHNEDWWVWWAASSVGAALWMIAFVCTSIYFWIGVPDGLRPPCQRGWEIVDGEHVLVRPGRTPHERAQRAPVTVDPA